MSDPLDSKRAIRAIARTLKAAKELFLTKDREIAKALVEADHWRAKYQNQRERFEKLFNVRVEMIPQDPKLRRCTIQVDTRLFETAKHPHDIIHAIGVELYKGLCK